MHWKTQRAGALVARILVRWSDAWREALAAALGATLSWLLASESYQADRGLVAGVATGIVIGEVTYEIQSANLGKLSENVFDGSGKELTGLISLPR